MNEELQQEFNELNKYREFAKLFFDIFELDYDEKQQVLTLKLDEKNCLVDKEISILLINEEANIFYETALQLENDEIEVEDEN